MKKLIIFKASMQLSGLVLAVTGLPLAMWAEEPANAAAEAGAKAVDNTAAKLRGYKTTHSEVSKAEVKAAMEQIDAELDHLEQLTETAPSPEKRGEVETHYGVLKQRRNELKREFTEARFASFQADLRAEAEKFVAWAREAFASKPAARSTASTTNDTAESGSRKIADYRSEATDPNQVETKAALNQLDADLEILSVKIEAVSDPGRKAEQKRRLEAYKDRRTELRNEFRQARYEALVADVKAEWNQLIN